MRAGTFDTVVALAGRRADAEDDSPPRFPAHNVARVEQQITTLFRQQTVGRLVCAAACGADLVALRVAEKLEIPALIVLPFDRVTFRRLSVIDRPGPWGELYDQLVDAADKRGDLISLNLAEEDELAFTGGNSRILAEARRTPAARRLAVAVWEGAARGNGDATAELLTEALKQGFETRSVLTA